MAQPYRLGRLLTVFQKFFRPLSPAAADDPAQFRFQRLDIEQQQICRVYGFLTLLQRNGTGRVDGHMEAFLMERPGQFQDEARLQQWLAAGQGHAAVFQKRMVRPNTIHQLLH